MIHNKLVGSSNAKIHVKSCRTFWYGKQMLVIVILKNRQGGVLCYHLTPPVHSTGKSLFTIRPEFDHFSAPLPWCRAPSSLTRTIATASQWVSHFTLFPPPHSRQSDSFTIQCSSYHFPAPNPLRWAEYWPCKNICEYVPSWICSLTGPKGLCRCD